MDTRWYEIMAQCMHLHQRRHTNSITEIVRINTLGQAGAGHRLSSQEARLQAFFESLADEGERKSCIVTAAAYASNDYIRVVVCTFQLEQRLFADDRLVHQYMVVPPLLAATSTASLIAIPRLPIFSGSCARMLRPASVRSVGLACTVAP